MLVTIVAVANADNTGLDLDRLERVEDLPDDLALNMLHFGTAREPSEAELANYHATPANVPTGTPADDIREDAAEPEAAAPDDE